VVDPQVEPQAQPVSDIMVTELSNSDTELSTTIVISSLCAADDFDEPYVIDVELGEPNKIKLVKALIDSGCNTVGVIDRRLLDQLEAVKIQLARPRPVKDFKGRSAPPIRSKVVFPMKVSSHWEPMASFYVTDLETPMIILGRPWLRQHGAVVDFGKESGSIVFGGSCQHALKPCAESHVDSNEDQSSLYVTASSVAVVPTRILQRPSLSKIMDPDVDRNGNKLLELARPSEEKEKLVRESAQREKRKQRRHQKYQKTARISAISAAAFNLLTRQKDHEIFAISFKDISDKARKRELAEEAASNLENLIPEEFKEFKLVFDKEAANKLADHRPAWDHKIELVEGATLPRTEPLRRMTTEELEVLKMYLEENLDKGWIAPSSFEYASPILFVKKPSGGIRFCIDYRRLNDITKKDRYPLPLIDETIARACKATIFSKFDIISAFHKLRMDPGSEDLTTFLTRYGAYKMKVMPFGLCNGPSSYQRFMNDNFLEMSDFVSIYLDDLLVFSNSRKEHTQHVRRVLQRLQELGLHANILKSEFYVTRTKYLGVILNAEGSSLQMDPAKIAVIKQWTRPAKGDIGSVADLRGVRQFLGFVNYYRRFISSFSKIARPLYELLQKDSLGIWTDACERAFLRLKEVMSSETVIQHFQPDRPTFVECDSSDFAVGGVLSQEGPDGLVRPVAFFSSTMSPAERNYAIYDKELLALIRCFEEWKPELLSTEDIVRVLTDHKALEYFMSTKQLTRRQARWAEFLSQFNFQITYRKGKQNEKADLLTRLPQYDAPRSKVDPHLYQTLLPTKNIDPELQIHATEMTHTSAILPLLDRVRQSNQEDAELAEVKYMVQKGKQGKFKGWDLDCCLVQDNILLCGSRLAVPTSQTTDVIESVHASKEVGHPGLLKTLQMIKKSFIFPRMRSLVQRYIRNCHVCCRVKVQKALPEGLLQPLPIPDQPWRDISMDFVTGFPTSRAGNDAILVVVDRFSKERHYIPCKKTCSAEDTAKLMINHVWKLHGLPSSIVSDRGTQFVSALWKHWCQVLRIQCKLSTAYHPQTDGQTENANAFMEQYLKAFVSYDQKDWEELLPMAEFAANSVINESLGTSPFFVSKGFEPRMSF
jgi:hypothetical protein